MKGREVIAKILKMEGVEFITGFPNAALQDGCAAEGIRCISFRNEIVSTQAADGYSRASFGQRIGVTSMQAGPGIEVAFAGVREAYSDNSPILVLPSAEARRRITTDPYFDAVANFRLITKWAETILFVERIPEIMRRAFTYLRMGRPRPVLVDLPKDMPNDEFPDALFQYKPVKAVRPSGDPAQVKEVVQMILAAKNPVIRAGQGILYARAWDELRELAETLQIPVYTTLNGKSSFPENHPLALGAGGRGHPATVPHFQKKADLIVAVGSSCTIESFTLPVAPGKALVQVTIDERDINKDYPVEGAIIGDAKLVLRQVLNEVKQRLGGRNREPNRELVNEIKAVKEEWLKKWLPKLTSDEMPINPDRVYWDLMKTLDRRQTILVPDSGAPRDNLTPFWETLIPGGYIGYGKDHMLGAGMGLAMGAKLARPEKTVVHVGGDGAFGQVGMDWETTVREKIPMINVVLNNGRMSGTHKSSPIAVEKYHINCLSGHYSKIADGLGSYAERVERPEDISS